MGAVCDHHELHAAADQMTRSDFAHLARPEDQHSCMREVVEDSARQVHSGVSDRESAATQAGLGLCALAGRNRLLEQFGKDFTSRLPGLCRTQSMAYLAENLAFAKYQRVQAAGDSEQVRGALLVESARQQEGEVGPQGRLWPSATRRVMTAEVSSAGRSETA